MESPERSESGLAAPVDPGSPFFKYLCGLSPIKPARSVHVVQTYAELSLPPPPTVFTSPANPHRGGGRSRRGFVVRREASTHVTVEVVGPWGNGWGGGGGGSSSGGGSGSGAGAGGDRKNELNQSLVRKSYAAAQNDGADLKSSHPSSEYNSSSSRQHFWRLQAEQQEQASGSSADTPTNFEYGDVADYLADPPEGGLYAAAATSTSSQLAVKSDVHKSSLSCDEGFGYYPEHVEGSLPKTEQHQNPTAECSADAPNGEAGRSLNAIQRGSSGSDAPKGEARTLNNVLQRGGSSGSGSDRDGGGGNSTTVDKKKSLILGEETARMAFLLVGGEGGGDGGDGGINSHDWGASRLDLAEFSRQHNPEFAAVERVASFAQLKTREDFELAASKAVENQRNAEAETRDREAAEDRKDAAVIVGNSTTGQRGVRRRCLDFEASARRKSMGNGSSRKRGASRSEALPGVSTTASRLPTAKMCERAIERAIATSDATNSVAATSGASESRSDVASAAAVIPECASSGNKVLSPGLVRISRSIVQRSADLMSSSSDQCATDPTRIVRDGTNSSPSIGIGIPSGIGLHLNSLTGRISFSPTSKGGLKQDMGIAAIPKGAVASLLGMPGLLGAKTETRAKEYGNTALSGGAGPSSNFSMGLSTSTAAASGVVMVMERSRMSLESLPVVDTSQGAPQINPMKSVADGGGGQVVEGTRPSSANGLEKQVGSAEKKRPLLPDAAHQTSPEEYESPRSGQKRRKSSSGSGEKSGEGCKRCTCKKSKCLKLYCECFAAGTYCVGSCTCRDCFNKPEHEETVMSTRRQIESRNPLAFAPKIVHSADGSSPKQGEETVETPASAHHKRGCNCKKSLCLKKYCECYQAGVGCSDGCRCEGCKNMYGRKESIEDGDEMETVTAEPLESGSMEDELDLPRPGFHGGPRTVDPNPNRNNRKELSPITPSFQYTGQGRAVERVRSAQKKRSPLSALQSLARPPRSPAFATRSSTKFLANSSAQQQTPELQHFKGVNSPNSNSTSTPKLSRVNQLSPRWDGLGDICTLTPLPQPPLRPTPASMSTLDRTSPSFSYQTIEPISSYQPDKLDSISKSSPPFQQASDHSPLSSCGLLTLHKESNHSAHCTAALPSTSTYPGVNNGKGEDTRPADISFMCDDDDTPDFLKYEDSINSPVVTKSGSPNQKRVSPPHFAGMRERNAEGRVVFESPARSSSGLRRGRKFILQALP